jgi:hypothetical protein|eukprot:SAG25_NODE_527_length_7183_cov_5.308018_10_plen_66_part_00
MRRRIDPFGERCERRKTCIILPYTLGRDWQARQPMLTWRQGRARSGPACCELIAKVGPSAGQRLA